MRRRWLLMLGGVVALGMITVFALALLIPRAPFRFLDGHRPSDVTQGFRDKLGHKGAMATHFYSFQADFEPLIREGRAELERLGFKANGGSGGLMFYQTQTSEGVLVLKDKRLSETAPNSWTEKAPGWVFVALYGNRQLGLWDRIKAVFGL